MREFRLRDLALIFTLLGFIEEIANKDNAVVLHPTSTKLRRNLYPRNLLFSEEVISKLNLLLTKYAREKIIFRSPLFLSIEISKYKNEAFPEVDGER